MKTRWWIALAAGLLAGTAAAGSGCVAYASDEIRIIGESEEETAPSDQAEDAAAEERVQGPPAAAQRVYPRMRHNILRFFKKIFLFFRKRACILKTGVVIYAG